MKSSPSAPRRRISTGWHHYWVSMGLLCVVTLILSFSVHLIFRRTAHITLPDSIGLTGNGARGDTQTAAVPLEVTADTVQSVIATLSRAGRYQRTVTIRRTWSGGSQDTVLTVTVLEPWTRVDRELPDGSTRHAVTNGTLTYLWYGDGEKVLQLPAGPVSADNEQLIPTYEDVLNLPPERIALADYHRIESGMDCIYVETVPENGSRERYWIGVSTGLLVAAETLLEENSVYWMEASEPKEPPEDAFTLPDGTVLAAEP